MSLLDRLLVAAGATHWQLTGRGRHEQVPGILVGLLVAAVVLPVAIVAATPQPEEATLEEIRLNLVTSPWLRVAGELREAEPWPDGTLRYALREPGNEQDILTVVATEPLPTGPIELTGRVTGGRPVEDSFGLIRADEPYVPPRDDPWVLLAVPAGIGLLLIAGGRAGYPVLRPERAAGTPRPLVEGESVAARWSGRIGDLEVPFERPRPCRLSVALEPGVAELTIADESGRRAVRLARTGRKQPLRVCTTWRCVPGLEAHGPALDLLLTFDDPAPRDRLAVVLQAPLAAAATVAATG